MHAISLIICNTCFLKRLVFDALIKVPQYFIVFIPLLIRLGVRPVYMEAGVGVRPVYMEAGLGVRPVYMAPL
jgi:hypothetical protein